jgi:hypothetical protein
MTTSVADRTELFVLHGTPEQPPTPKPVGGESLSALLESADLRDIRTGGLAVISRLYAAVRDQRWGTATPQSMSVETEQQGAATTIRWRASFDDVDIKLDAEGEYEIDGEGGLVATFRAIAREDTTYNRIGFCLLLPPSEFAGRPLVADGSKRYLLSEEIGPQRIVEGLPAPLFPAASSLAMDGRSGTSLRLEFEGDSFEVEDQRNWTDDSFKIYSTPLSRGFPQRAAAGSRIEQRVVVSVLPRSDRRRKASTTPVRLTLGEPLGRALPSLGFTTPSDGALPDAATTELLREARPRHLRACIPAEDAGEALDRARGWVELLDTTLQIEVTGDPATSGLESAASRITDVIVVGTATALTTAAEVRAVRERLSPILQHAAFHAGTRSGFCELNRGTIQSTDGVDGVCYAIQPQAHAFDDASLFETLPVQAETVANARRLFPALRVLVGPVTLRERPHADTRQLSLLGAAWTLGSISHLAAAGPDAVTYYETTGACGLMESTSGPTSPHLFPSVPGETFPLYHVLADAGQVSGELVQTSSSDSRASVAVGVVERGRAQVLIANLVPEPLDVEIAQLPAGAYKIRRLNAETAALAADAPGEFRTSWELLKRINHSKLRLRLEPYETARLEAT